MILLSSLFVSQFVIMFWKSRHPSSFNAITLLGLWVIPMGMGVNAGNVRYVVIWALFSIVTGIIIKRALSVPLKKETPGMVYGWFAGVYSVSYGLVLIGYFVVLLALFRIPELIFGITAEGDESLFQVCPY